MIFRNTTCLTFIAGAALVVSAGGQSARPAAIPRLVDGKPNFNGIWQTIGSADMDLQSHVADRTTAASQSLVEEGTIPYLADALKQRQTNFDKRRTNDPEFAKCNLPGVPRITYAHNLPFQIFQLPKGDKMTVLYEYAEAHRFIYTNGTPHPFGHINWYLGDSRGKWEGDTLVVDSVDFLDDIWLDHAGDYIDQNFHVIERFKYIDADHLDYKVEIDDPKIYSKPWHIDLILYRHKEKNFQLLDYVCYAFPIDKYYP